LPFTDAMNIGNLKNVFLAAGCGKYHYVTKCIHIRKNGARTEHAAKLSLQCSVRSELTSKCPKKLYTWN